jgi:Lysine methyltransferase
MLSNDLGTMASPAHDLHVPPAPQNENHEMACDGGEHEIAMLPVHEATDDGESKRQAKGIGSHFRRVDHDETGPLSDDLVERSNSGAEHDDEEEFESRYNDRFHSIRSGTGLEVGILVTWPGTMEPTARTDNYGHGAESSRHQQGWELSTCLSSDCIAPLFHGTQWAGTRVWRAAVVALEYLLSDEAEVTIRPHHALLELGCGLGVPGMVLHALRKCTTILTDMGDLIPTVQENLRRAFPDSVVDQCTDSRIGGTIEARELDWSVAGVNRLRNETGVSMFDVALNCDCIFEPLYGDSWKHLLQCQVALLELNPSAYVLTSVERRRYDGIDKYLQAAEDAGLVPLPVYPQSVVHPPQVELYRLVRSPSVVAPVERDGQINRIATSSD